MWLAVACGVTVDVRSASMCDGYCGDTSVFSVAIYLELGDEDAASTDGERMRVMTPLMGCRSGTCVLAHRYRRFYSGVRRPVSISTGGACASAVARHAACRAIGTRNRRNAGHFMHYKWIVRLAMRAANLAPTQRFAKYQAWFSRVRRSRGGARNKGVAPRSRRASVAVAGFAWRQSQWGAGGGAAVQRPGGCRAALSGGMRPMRAFSRGGARHVGASRSQVVAEQDRRRAAQPVPIH